MPLVTPVRYLSLCIIVVATRNTVKSSLSDDWKHKSHFIPYCFDVSVCSCLFKGHALTCCVLSLPLIDKLTKEEEEIYKLQHDLERTVISQQQSKKISEVRDHSFNTKQIFTSLT